MLKLILVISLLILLPTNSPANNYNDAAKKAAETVYNNSEFRHDIERWVDQKERKYIPVIIRNNRTWIVLLLQTYSSQQFYFSYRWEFP